MKPNSFRSFFFPSKIASFSSSEYSNRSKRTRSMSWVSVFRFCWSSKLLSSFKIIILMWRNFYFNYDIFYTCFLFYIYSSSIRIVNDFEFSWSRGLYKAWKIESIWPWAPCIWISDRSRNKERWFFSIFKNYLPSFYSFAHWFFS